MRKKKQMMLGACGKQFGRGEAEKKRKEKKRKEKKRTEKKIKRVDERVSVWMVGGHDAIYICIYIHICVCV